LRHYYYRRSGEEKTQKKRRVMENKFTYEQIARSFQLWGEYVDPMATMTEEQFEEMEMEERLQIMVDCFGPEQDDEPEF
jgi:hypothetical protein